MLRKSRAADRGSAAPGEQDGVEAADLGTLVLNGLGDGLEHRALAAQQVRWIAARPVQQGELEQQVRADVPHVLDGSVQPALRRLAARRRDRVDGPLRAQALLGTLGETRPAASIRAMER